MNLLQKRWDDVRKGDTFPRVVVQPCFLGRMCTAVELIARFNPPKAIALIRCVFGIFPRKSGVGGRMPPCAICPGTHTGHHVNAVISRGCFWAVLTEVRAFTWVLHSSPHVLMDQMRKVATDIAHLGDLGISISELFHLHLHGVWSEPGLTRADWLKASPLIQRSVDCLLRSNTSLHRLTTVGAIDTPVVLTAPIQKKSRTSFAQLMVVGHFP
eukprot:115576-Amphidinium_carterae.1